LIGVKTDRKLKVDFVDVEVPNDEQRGESKGLGDETKLIFSRGAARSQRIVDCPHWKRFQPGPSRSQA
jgi:hypothetical protein